MFLLAKNIEANLAHSSSSFSTTPSSSHQTDGRDKKMFRRIKRQLSLTTDKADLPGTVAVDRSKDLEEDDELEVQTMLTPDDLEDGLGVVGFKEEVEEDEISVNEDDKVDSFVSGGKLEVNETHWETDNKQQTTVLRDDPRIRICHLDWEQRPSLMPTFMQADVILGAGMLEPVCPVNSCYGHVNRNYLIPIFSGEHGPCPTPKFTTCLCVWTSESWTHF